MKRTRRGVRPLPSHNSLPDEQGNSVPAASSTDGPGRARETLLHAEASYRTFVERLPLIFYIDEPNEAASNLYTSPQTTPILGYTPEDWASDPGLFPKVLHPDDREEVLAQHARTNATGEPLRIEYRLISRDGREVWVRDEGALVRDKDGKAVSMQGYLLDITERKQREAAVRESEARTRAMLDAALDGVITIDHEGRIIEFNPAAESMFGHLRSDVIGQQMAELVIPPLLREAHSRGFQRYLATEQGSVLGQRLEMPALRAGGREFPIELSIVRVDVPGPPVFTAYIRDITERKRSEALAVGQARLLELIAAGAPLPELLDLLARFVEEQSKQGLVSILLLDRDGQHLRHGAAPSLNETYNTALDGLRIGPSVGSCGTAAYRRERILVTDIANDPLWGELRKLALNNGLRACCSTPIFATDASVLGTFAMYYRDPCEPSEHDLQLVEMATHIGGIAIERARSEEALRESEVRYRDLFENASDMIMTVDLDWNITDANKASVETVDYSREELLQMNLAELLPPEVHELARSQLARKLAHEVEVTTYEVEFVAKDGHRVPIEVKTRVIWQDGEPTGIEAIARDVSERKRLEQQLQQAQKMEAVGQLAGGVAHDFNNMMSAVIGFSELVLNRLEADHPVRRQVEEIRRAGERASDMTHQLLAFSRKQVLQPKVLDLNAIVAETQKLLERLIGEDVELVSVPDPDLDPIEADPGQLGQVLMNLAVNARDAMPGGGKLTFETRNVELDDGYSALHVDVEPGAYVLLSVSDTGTGMDAETRLRIFEPFFTTKEEGAGSGLGLATVYGIVTQSGGAISVYSEPGRGTTFKIYLPRAAQDSREIEDRSVRRDAPRGSETILLVEDEALVRSLEVETLEERGYTVLEAHSPGHALELCRQHEGTIDLLLTDVVMPEMNGHELAGQLAVIRPSMKVLYSSGYADGAIVHHGVIEPGTAFLPKPLTPGTLARKVREVLDSQEPA
jgi:two-component system cell cycle sensor histidine kinase/response regulator CckA